MRNLSAEQLKPLADELRAETIETVSVTGGHLGSSLGVVELTVAVHAVFDTPRDKIVWDVGHQAYPHKILTGPARPHPHAPQGGGFSGFTRAARASSTPSARRTPAPRSSPALGMAVARDLRAGARTIAVIAVIGDGAMSAGMAYEAMNNAGDLQRRLIVILNDNDMSIAPPVGAISAYLTRPVSSRPLWSCGTGWGGSPSGARRRCAAAAKGRSEFGAAGDGRHSSSRSWDFTTSGRSTGTTSTTWCPCCGTRRRRPKGPVLLHV